MPKLRLIDDWRRCWRLASIQLHAAALAWMALYAVMPVLDPAIAALLPSPFRAPVVAGYAILGVIARLVVAQRSA